MSRPPAKRRSRGSIDQRGNSFRVRVYAGDDPLTGKALYLTGSAPTEREAEKIRTRLLADVADRAQAELTARHAGDETPEQRVTAEEWMAAE